MRKTLVVIISIVLCLVALTNVFANENYKALDISLETFSLEDALYFNPTLYSIDVLTFLQAYLRPEDPYNFFIKASQYTDSQIEENFIIYQAFVENELTGRVSFAYSCDVEQYAKEFDYYLDPNLEYSLSMAFADLEDLAEIFPRGIGRTDAYNTFRRTAIHLAYYVSKHGSTAGFWLCDLMINEAIAWYEDAFDQAMAEEALNNQTMIEN